MIVKMFKPQFAAAVAAGIKLQTVRPTPKRMPQAGDKISLRQWTGLPYRSKQRILNESRVAKVSKVEITDEGWIWIDDMRIKTRNEFEKFSRADGFLTPERMLEFFRETHGLPFTGIVIYWDTPCS